MHSVTLAYCQKQKEVNNSWTWNKTFPHLSTTIDNLDQLSFLKEIIPNTLKLLGDKDPTYKGSKLEEELLTYSNVILTNHILWFNCR